MKAYICDACGKVIDDPHEVGMKEFSVLAEDAIRQEAAECAEI